MLEVVDIDTGAAAPELTGDDHVPLMVRWGLSPAVVWQATFPDGRIFCEIKLSVPGGRMNGVTVLNLPKVESASASGSATWDETGVPVLSLDTFDPNPDLVPQTNIVKFECSPSAIIGAEWFELRFDDSDPVKWSSVEGIGFGIDDRDRVVAIRVPTVAAKDFPLIPTVDSLAQSDQADD